MSSRRETEVEVFKAQHQLEQVQVLQLEAGQTALVSVPATLVLPALEATET